MPRLSWAWGEVDERWASLPCSEPWPGAWWRWWEAGEGEGNAWATSLWWTLGVTREVEVFEGRRGRPPPLFRAGARPFPSVPAPQRRIEHRSQWFMHGSPSLERGCVPLVGHSDERLAQYLLDSAMWVGFRPILGSPVCTRVANVAADTPTQGDSAKQHGTEPDGQQSQWDSVLLGIRWDKEAHLKSPAFFTIARGTCVPTCRGDRC